MTTRQNQLIKELHDLYNAYKISDLYMDKLEECEQFAIDAGNLDLESELDELWDIEYKEVHYPLFSKIVNVLIELLHIDKYIAQKMVMQDKFNCLLDQISKYNL